MPTGEFLLNPDRAVAVVSSLADFRKNARDNAHGGFYTFVSSNGTVSGDRRKSFVTQSRDAYGFVRAFMLTGDDVYLDYAAHALDYLYAHGWDWSNGGWFFSGDERGALVPFYSGWDPNGFKWSFPQHYALLGIGAMCEATWDADACVWLTTGRRLLDSRMWDSTGGRLGYYEEANLNFSNPRMKSFTATVDALTTHGIALDLLQPTAAHHLRMVQLADATADRLAPSMSLSYVKFGFPEFFNDDWSVSWSRTDGYVGHVLKSAWVLARAYMLEPNPRYREAAREFIYEVVDGGGWDRANGVPYTSTNWSSGWINRGESEYWQIEQAFTGGISNWYISENAADKELFLHMADSSLQFFADHVLDRSLGGSFMMNAPSGSVLNSAKGDAFKAEYHAIELFYFAYLYGNLMYRREPVALHYKVPALGTQRTVRLNPLAIDDDSLQITEVRLNGAVHSAFVGAAREVTLAAGQGGELRVVFAPAG